MKWMTIVLYFTQGIPKFILVCYTDQCKQATTGGSTILMLYNNCITLIYFFALYVLFVFYVQRWTIRESATQCFSICFVTSLLECPVATWAVANGVWIK